ncbi:MAG: glucokinase [Spirochaetaceae bacterium]|nr:MAG: glucokinase [Spirochaetaceae bacterium]
MEFTTADRDHVSLVGDIGGTNLTLALMAHENKRMRLIDTVRLASQELSAFDEAISHAEQRWRGPHWDQISACCFTAAGPVSDNRVALTNVRWGIDGNAVSDRLGVPARVINDFTGVCYGIPVLAGQAPDSFTSLPHCNGGLPTAQTGTIAVIGAGTGLGVGSLVVDGDRVSAFPSEGGHSGFAPIDEETVELWKFLADRYGAAPGAECVLSGRGIVNIFDFLISCSEASPTAQVDRIRALPSHERPREISAHADTDPVCRRTMELFVRVYGAVASSTALSFLSTGGLFLAGGIAAKNVQWFLEDHRFMRAFETNYLESIRDVLRRIPVAIVGEYAVSLYGAAYAAEDMLRTRTPKGDT